MDKKPLPPPQKKQTLIFWACRLVGYVNSRQKINLGDPLNSSQ